MSSAHPLQDQQRHLSAAIVAEAPGAGVAAALLRPRAGGELLGIYRHAYRARLAEALRDNHEQLPRVMGDEAFDALAAAYIDAHPSRQPSIRWYGEQLADFMDANPDLAPHPALTDLARMEWALRGAFDAGDASPLAPQALAAIAPEAWPALHLTPQPSARLVPLHWAVEPLWRALQQAGDDVDAVELPEPEAHDHLLLVWRPQLETRWRSLDVLEAALLRALFVGEPFGALCEIAAAERGEEQAAALAVGALQGWLAEGLLAAAS